MLTHTTQLRVRYSETDQMGYVYYGQYATYFEVGRVETMRAAGLQYAKLESEHGIMMPVMNVQMRFVRPAKYDDLLSVTTSVRQLHDNQIVFHTDVFRPDGKLSAAGRVTLCILTVDTHKRIAVPDFIKRTLQKYFD